MRKEFWIFLLAGLAVVAALIFGVFSTTKGAHLRLDGQILKVRTMEAGPKASVVIIDFRVDNPSDVQFVVKTVRLEMTPATGEKAEGVTISKSDMANIFQYAKVLGPMYNEVMAARAIILPKARIDRTAGARFEFTEAEVSARKSLRLILEDVDGTVSEIGEKK